MAQPPPYNPTGQPGYQVQGDGPPPPAYVYQSPGQAGPPPPVVQAQPAQPKKKKGFFDSMMDGVDKLSKQMEKEINYCSNKISETFDKNYSSSLLSLFATNNTIQMLPRSTQKTVQILLSPEGLMMLDANGPHDPRPFHTWFTVSNEGSNRVRLFNNNNYLAIVQGAMTLLPVTPGVPLTTNSLFQLSQSGSFVTMECVGERGKFLGFLPTGQPKLPCGLKKELDTQFSIKLVSTGYPAATTK